MKSGWVYILECSDGSYYTGVTSDIDSRFAEHQQAIDMEKRIKGWRRQKKEALMAGDFTLLQELSKSYMKSERNN
jgi:putative endonuclease